MASYQSTINVEVSTTKIIQMWILSMKPQNLLVHTTDIDSSIGALADVEFLNILALSVDQGRESRLELSHRVHEWVRI